MSKTSWQKHLYQHSHVKLGRIEKQRPAWQTPSRLGEGCDISPAHTDCIQKGNEVLICLSPYFSQLHIQMDALLPALGLQKSTLYSGFRSASSRMCSEKQQHTWKQNLGWSVVLLTGGNCRKSPQIISWIPPNGSPLFLTPLPRESTGMKPYPVGCSTRFQEKIT